VTSSISAATSGQEEQQPHRAGHLPGLENGQRECAVGDELALRNEDDPGNREQEDDAHAQQRVHRAVGQAIHRQHTGNGEIHG
jgi:hypothetical protein